MGRLLSRAVSTIAACCFVATLVPGAVAARPVELELVLAVDVSASVTRNEFELQMRGYAAAFRAPQVLEAISAAAKDGVAVTMMQWASRDQQDVVIAWTHVYDEASAEAFAKTIDTTPRRFEMGQTAMGHALQFCLKLFPARGFEGRRRVIDVSGDGYSNQGIAPNGIRDQAVAMGIAINGLPITNKEGKIVVGYYERNVIGGPNSFMIVANNYQEFADAIQTKLIREIRGAPIAETPAEDDKIETAFADASAP
jgi:Protein of unknown function (DUF1194)